MFLKTHNPVSIKQKAAEFLSSPKNRGLKGRTMNIDKSLFNGNNYFANPSCPFINNGRKLIAVRECTRAEVTDRSVFLKLDGDGVWRKLENAVSYELQDPYICEIGGEYVFGGVKAWKPDMDKWTWLCEFYRGKDINSLRHLLTGPTLMKDIRLVGLNGGRVGIFTRPQGILYRKRSGNIADIGYTEADSLDGVDSHMMVTAPVLKGVFRPDEWGGVNQVYPLKNGLLGIIGHFAYGDGEFREGLAVHYYGMAFAFNPKTAEFTEPKVIAARDNFEHDLHIKHRAGDVIFSAGIERITGGKAMFYSGVADNFIGQMEIDDPFAEYESVK